MKWSVAPTPHLRRAGLFIAIASLVAIGLATLLPQPGAALGSHMCLLCGPLGGVNSLLNILLFVPLGVGLALSGFRGTRAVVAICALSILIETAQLLVIPGRYSTLGDVLTNTLGGWLGFVIGRYADGLLRPPRRAATALTIGWSALWLAIQAASAFGFSLRIPRSEYYGEIAPNLGDFEQFDGSVLRATVADATLSDARVEDSPRMRQLLLGGAIVSLSILPSRPESGIAPIVRVADTGEREILLIAQAASELVFGVRTGASTLRLRPPLLAAHDVFPAAAGAGKSVAPDTITVWARYHAGEGWLKTRGGTNAERRIPITTSLGWTLLLPFQWLIQGTGIELTLSALWSAFLALPIGYWGRRVVQPPGTRAPTKTRVIGLSMTLTLIYIGLVATPHGFGLRAASLLDWLAVTTGILSGLVLAIRAA